MPSAQVNIINCLILESKIALKYIPSHHQIYFINSKRRFFLYFKSHRQMLEAMRIFTENGVKFYRRESLLPDREEHEEQVYHCYYRYKKMDLRRNLMTGTPYNEPKLHFEKYEKARNRYQNVRNDSPKKNEPTPSLPLPVPEQKLPPNPSPQPPFNGFKFKNEQVCKILQNKQLLNHILFSLNFEG